MYLVQPKGQAERVLIGWNEWCSLPDLGIPAIKAKIDTGAKTSALHAFDITPIKKNGKNYVRFCIHPLQRNSNINIPCEALIIDTRDIMSSTGHIEHRFVIQTELHLGEIHWPIELTLSNRDPLRFRMLLGREALYQKVIIDPSLYLCQGRITITKLLKLYPNRSTS